VLWTVDLVVVLAVVLVYTAVNIAVTRAFRTEFRDEFSVWRHLLIPAAAILVFLFPLWGIFFPGTYTLMNVLPFIALGWLLIGVAATALIRRAIPVALTG
jgi:amino acid transporter